MPTNPTSRRDEPGQTVVDFLATGVVHRERGAAIPLADLHAWLGEFCAVMRFEAPSLRELQLFLESVGFEVVEVEKCRMVRGLAAADG